MSINIFGEIGFDVTAKEVFDQIGNEKGEEIEVIISSGGGSAFEGLMIFDALKATGKTIHTKIMGLGASAASVIFMAGDNREIGEGGLLMVHNSWSMFMGNAKEVREQLGTLDAIDARMTAIFMKGTGLDEEKVVELLKDETFMGVEEAVELGFATGQIEAAKVAASLYKSYNKEKEPLNMADIKEVEELDEKEKGMFAKFLSWASNQPKAEDADEEEVVEEAKAEGDEEEVDVEALQAELAELKAAAAKAEDEMEEKAKAEKASAELAKVEASEKNSIIFAAMQSDKILASKAADLVNGSLEDVKSHLEGIEPNATGRGSEGEPVKGSDVSKYELYKAIKDPAERSAYYSKHKNEIKKQSKES